MHPSRNMYICRSVGDNGATTSVVHNYTRLRTKNFTHCELVFFQHFLCFTSYYINTFFLTIICDQFPIHFYTDFKKN